MRLTRRTLLRGTAGAGAAGAAGAALFGSVAAPREPEPPTALVAGSLLRLGSHIPGATVEAHGSAAVRQLVVNGIREPDVVALADPRLFDGVSDRATHFATNALVLAYAPESPHARAFERDWRTALTREGVWIGRTDPDHDPLGYRTVMGLELAERRSGVPADDVLDATTIFRETDLLNAVETGKLDAAFAYRNMAVQRDLPYVSLPDEIDFSNPSHAERYAAASYDLDGRTIHGTPIRYAATATTARGESWVEDLVTARALAEEMGFGVPANYPLRDRRVPAID